MHPGGWVAPLVGQEQVVEQCFARPCELRAADGDVVARAAIVGETDYIHRGGSGEGDGVDRHKGGGVVAAFHHSDDKQGEWCFVSPASGKERQGEVAHVINRRVDRGQHGIQVACVGVVVVDIPVQALVAVDDIDV